MEKGQATTIFTTVILTSIIWGKKKNIFYAIIIGVKFHNCQNSAIISQQTIYLIGEEKVMIMKNNMKTTTPRYILFPGMNNSLVMFG